MIKQLVFVLAASLLVLSCTNKNTREADKPLTIRLSKEPSTLDWNKASGTPSRLIIFNLMDPLIEFSYENGKVKARPGLISSWRVEDGGKRYVFELKKGVKWSDGVLFTSQNIADSFERMLSPSTESFSSFLYYVIKGAEEYNKGKNKDFKKVGIHILTESEIAFDLNFAYSSFPKLLGLFNTLPIRKDLIAKFGENNWWRPENLVTLGPYVLDNVEGRSKFSLKARGDYYREPAKFNRVTFMVVEDGQSATALFDTGEFDLVEGIPSEMIGRYKNEKSYRRVENIAIEYLGFNVNQAPFDNLENRKSFSCAIDYQSLRKVLIGGEKTNQMFLPKGLEGYDSKFRIDCGKIEKNVLKVRPKLSYYTDANQKKIMEFVQNQLKIHLGWDSEIRNQEWKVYIAQVNSNPPMVYRLGWLAIFPDPSLYLSLFTSESHFNTSGWKNKKYDELYERVIRLAPGPERVAAIQSAEDILVNQARVVVPLYDGVRHFLVSDRLSQVDLDPLNRILIRKF